MFVVPNLDEFEAAWSLDRADLRFYVAIHEVVHAADALGAVGARAARQPRRPSTSSGATTLRPRPAPSSHRFGGPRSRRPVVAPGVRGAARAAARRDAVTQRQEALLGQARVFHAVLEGYADVVLERVGTSPDPVVRPDPRGDGAPPHRAGRGRAVRRRGCSASQLGREDYERGARVLRGRVERAGLDGLNRLWERRSDGADAGRDRRAGALARAHRPARGPVTEGDRD